MKPVQDLPTLVCPFTKKKALPRKYVTVEGQDATYVEYASPGNPSFMIDSSLLDSDVPLSVRPDYLELIESGVYLARKMLP